MDDFLHRTITEESKEFGIKVCRSRSSRGAAGITIIVERKGAGDQRIDFDNSEMSVHGFGDKYESAAHELVGLLDRVVTNRCALPEPKGETNES